MPIDQKTSKVIVKTENGLVQVLPETSIAAVDGLSTELAGVVHTTGAETVDGIKSFSKNTMTEAIAVTGSSIDVSTGSFFTKTISADVTFTFTGVPAGKACVFTLILTNGGAYEITWPNNVTWSAGDEPELKSVGKDVLTFFTVDGGTSWTEVSGSGAAGGGSGSISDSGVIPGSYGPSINETPTYGNTFTVPQITVNQKGQVTAAVNKTVTIPASDNTDTKVDVTLVTQTRAYLLGTTTTPTGSAQSVSAIADDAVYLTETPGNLHANRFVGVADRATADADDNTISTTYAKLASPALTGTPTAPTATAGTNTTQIATTAFVANALSGFTPANNTKEVGYVTVEPTTSSVASLDNESVIFFEDESAAGTITSGTGGTVSASTYVGATSEANGVAGLVPAATSAERNNSLKGDGTWGSISLPGTYIGATSNASGTSGLVPVATSAEKDNYLKGDGTWGSISLPSTYVGATSEANGVAGLVPAANSEDRTKCLRGDGTWAYVVQTSGTQTIYDQKIFMQGPYGTTSAVSASEINLANGSVFTKTISANTTFTITGAPSGKAASFSLVLTNGGAYTITWPSSVKWAGGNVPTLTASGVDLLTFLTPDGGTTWYGVLSVGGAA